MFFELYLFLIFLNCYSSSVTLHDAMRSLGRGNIVSTQHCYHGNRTIVTMTTKSTLIRCSLLGTHGARARLCQLRACAGRSDTRGEPPLNMCVCVCVCVCVCANAA